MGVALWLDGFFEPFLRIEAAQPPGERANSAWGCGLAAFRGAPASGYLVDWTDRRPQPFATLSPVAVARAWKSLRTVITRLWLSAGVSGGSQARAPRGIALVHPGGRRLNRRAKATLEAKQESMSPHLQGWIKAVASARAAESHRAGKPIFTAACVASARVATFDLVWTRRSPLCALLLWANSQRPPDFRHITLFVVKA